MMDESQIQQQISEASRNVLKSREYLNARGKLVVPIGSTDIGTIHVEDISRIPHMLICGVSGSGKTAFVQTIIGCLVSKYSADDVKFLVYDSKMVEYPGLNSLPHMFAKVVTSLSDLQLIIRLLEAEIDRRYKAFVNAGARDINAYKNTGGTMPELFFILDDLSQVGMNYDCGVLFDTILKKGRSTGVHCIFVTSYTSDKVISKELVSNIPCRIAFRVASKADSKIALENNGAESLSVPGEIIFKWHVSMLKMKSVYMTQMVFEDTVEHAVQYEKLTVPRIGDIAARIFSVDAAGGDNDVPSGAEKEIAEDDYDEYLPQAIDAVIETGACSVSILQRRMKLGYSRAARIVDQMEKLGVVGPYEGAKPRSVLVDYNPFYSDEEDLDEDSDYDDDEASDVEYEDDINQSQSRDIPLRDFKFFTTKGGTVSVYGNRVHLSKQVMTRMGKGWASSELSGKVITGIFYKAPSVFSNGFFQLSYSNDAKIENHSPHIMQLNNRNAAEFYRIEIGKTDVGIVTMFLRQLSEDTGVPVTRV